MNQVEAGTPSAREQADRRAELIQWMLTERRPILTIPRSEGGHENYITVQDAAAYAAVRHADPWVRELERAARTYYTRYAQDEAYDVEDCCAGEQQHIDAKALRDALANVPAAPAPTAAEESKPSSPAPSSTTETSGKAKI